jgi:hypothetical protein
VLCRVAMALISSWGSFSHHQPRMPRRRTGIRLRKRAPGTVRQGLARPLRGIR